MEAPDFQDRLGVRAANILGRAGFAEWSNLCRVSPGELQELPGAGWRTVEEILAAVAREWALAYLRRWETGGAKKEVEEEVHGLVPLASAFEEIERISGFEVFELRHLQMGPPPTFRSLAEKAAVSRNAVAVKPARIDQAIAQRMRSETWPLRIAVDYLQDRLGALARPSEFDDLIAALNRDVGGLSGRMSQRRALLLHIAEYRESDDWILGPDIEKLTATVIDALSGEGSSDVDLVGRHLSRLGIREHLQLPWLASQFGYRIIDGGLVPLNDLI
ncbi:MAG TPA: hypothetical protein VK480_11120 [Solirubrobacterales bacterium]|nr:hypothetical protein [Solirubrobacterales bacterium]